VEVAAEDMERNVDEVRGSEELRDGARMLVSRAVHAARILLDHETALQAVARGGRKAHPVAPSKGDGRAGASGPAAPSGPAAGGSADPG
jgi:hypothetical protein